MLQFSRGKKNILRVNDLHESYNLIKIGRILNPPSLYFALFITLSAKFILFPQLSQ